MSGRNLKRLVRVTDHFIWRRNHRFTVSVAQSGAAAGLQSESPEWSEIFHRGSDPPRGAPMLNAQINITNVPTVINMVDGIIAGDMVVAVRVGHRAKHRCRLGVKRSGYAALFKRWLSPLSESSCRLGLSSPTASEQAAAASAEPQRRQAPRRSWLPSPGTMPS